jgi:hypothetical protein
MLPGTLFFKMCVCVFVFHERPLSSSKDYEQFRRLARVSPTPVSSASAIRPPSIDIHLYRYNAAVQSTAYVACSSQLSRQIVSCMLGKPRSCHSQNSKTMGPPLFLSATLCLDFTLNTLGFKPDRKQRSMKCMLYSLTALFPLVPLWHCSFGCSVLSFQ